MERKKKSIIWTIIKIFILIAIVVFIYGCYNFSFLKNNKNIVILKEKIGIVLNDINDKTNGSLSAIVENYEPDNEDTNIYEIADSQNRYYYNQLDDNSKVIYAEILNNIEKIKSGEDYIKISSKLSSLARKENMNDELMNAFQNAWDAFRNDNVDIFYIDGSKMCLVTKTIKRGSKTTYEFYISKGQNSNYLINGLNSAEDVTKANNFVEQKENEILNSITEKNDYYKIVKAHNWIVDNLEYNMQESSDNANIYGALKNKTVVCEGYARLFKSLMDKMNIPCVLVSGEGIDIDTGSRENHAWNYVYLHGEWYAIDTTWDDPVIIGDGKVNQDIKYKYFLLGSNNFFKTHIEDGKLADNGMKFVYPILSKEDYIKEK